MRLLTRTFAAAFICSAPALVLFASPAAAAGSGQLSQLTWNWEPWVLTSLALALFGYLCGVRRLDRVARLRVFGGTRCVAFAAGVVTLFVALVSPLDALDDQLFSAHMVQHLLLMMVAAPLLVWGRPAMAWLWAFPLPARRAIGRVWVRTGLHDGVHDLMSPLVVWMLCSAVLWFWHVPGPYGWALASESVHTLEHFCFFVTALMFWSLVLEPFGPRRLDYGSTLLFVATLGVQNGLLGALLTFAGRPLYVAYLPTTAAWGFTPLEDQQLAGLIMWIPASLIHLTTLGVLFVAWMHTAERHATIAATTRLNATLPNAALRCALLVPILMVGMSGCDRNAAEPHWRMIDANASRGPALIQAYGCVSCHTVPGVTEAKGNVGPPLAQFGRRVYIAGMLRNTPDNLIKWLRKPQSVVPGNAMPDMNVTEQDARDLAAYLYTLPGR